MASASRPPPPHPSLILDDPAAADPARAHLQSKSSFHRLLSFVRLPSKSSHTSRGRSPQPERPPSADPSLSTPSDYPDIHLDTSDLNTDDDKKDRYEWAVLYENQRGMTIFSVPYYSHMSLLPHDPSPFTLPDGSTRRSKQPALTLANYPLPDGTWKWVSRCWMIDMRSDGEVQHDGFQYNWLFRKHHWRASVGLLSSGGWVRRRRWIRLMMRPANTRLDEWDDGILAQVSSSSGTDSNRAAHQSLVSSLPTSFTFSLPSEVELLQTWTGKDTTVDWQRCRKALVQCARDSRRLELWRAWLGSNSPKLKCETLLPDSTDKQIQSNKNNVLSKVDPFDVESSTWDDLPPVPSTYMVPVLRSHGSDILHMFVYPESRVQFLKLLTSVGLLSEVKIGLYNENDLEFWSYANELGLGVLEHERVEGKSNRSE